MAWAGALYYPFMRVRDTAWLKAAALYWDSLHRFQPHGYDLRETPETRALVEADFLHSLNPAPYADEVAIDLLAFTRAHTDVLQRRFSVYDLPTVDGPSWGTEGPDRGHMGLGWIHISKMSGEFADYLRHARLARRSRGGDPHWIGLHPTVAAAYMLALTGTCAYQNRLEPVTDHADARLSPTQGVDAAMRLLTDDTVDPRRMGHHGDPSSFAMLAIESVMPRNLTKVSVQRILDTKEKLIDELTTFRAFVVDQQSELEQLAGIRDREVRARALAEHVKQQVVKPLERLEKGLRLLGFDTVRTLLTQQTVTPPALLTGAGWLADVPPVVTVTGGIAVTVGTAWWQLREDKKHKVQESSVGYLLGVKRALKARTVAERMAKMLRRS